MALTDAYLIKTSNVPDFFNALQGARAPDKFTHSFLEQLDFKSSNDRLFVKLLKELGFLDGSGIPTQRYFDFLDQSQAGAVLAEAIEEAYSDLFSINKNANELPETEVRNKLRSLTQGKKSDAVINNSARTFKALCDYADWQGLERKNQKNEDDPRGDESDDQSSGRSGGDTGPNDDLQPKNQLRGSFSGLHYNIQIHLPESRDPKVYEAIFQALRKHIE